MEAKKKLRRCRRTYGEREMVVRGHHMNVRHMKKWCEENNVQYKTWKEADDADICVVSFSDYDLHERRDSCLEDNESYFLNENDYGKWCEN